MFANTNPIFPDSDPLSTDLKKPYAFRLVSTLFTRELFLAADCEEEYETWISLLNAKEGEERGEEKDTLPTVLAKVRLGLFKGIRYFDLLQQLLMHRIEITFIPLNNAVICMYNVCLSSLEKIFLRKFKIVLF